MADRQKTKIPSMLWFRLRGKMNESDVCYVSRLALIDCTMRAVWHLLWVLPRTNVDGLLGLRALKSVLSTKRKRREKLESQKEEDRVYVREWQTWQTRLRQNCSVARFTVDNLWTRE